MIRFIGGKPGGSKSLYAMVRMIEELRSTNRFIVTNVAVEMLPWIDGGGVARKGLRGGCISKYGEDFDCNRRVIFLEDEQVKRFYAYRPRMKETGEVEVMCIPPITTGPMEGRFRFTTGQDGLSGCAYFIDEAHEFFSSREWQKTGKEVLSWASQQRRAGDDAWFLTQVIGNVEKQLRGVSQECYWMVNHRLLSLGFFRQPDILTYKLYGSTPPVPTETPLARGRVQCDRQFIYGTYNTAKGVGVAGRQADIGVRAKGLHWSWVLVFIALVSGGAIFANKALQGGIRKAIGIAPEYAQNAIAPVATNSPISQPAPPQLVSKLLPPMPSVPLPPIASQVAVSPPTVPVPWVRAHTTSSNRISLLMSDGEVVTGTNWQKVYRGWAVEGRFYPGVRVSQPTSFVEDKPRLKG